MSSLGNGNLLAATSYRPSDCNVQAVTIDKVGQKRTAVYPLDRPGNQMPLLLPTVNAGGQTAAFSHVQSLSKAPNVSNDVKQKLSSLLAAEFSKKVGRSNCSNRICKPLGKLTLSCIC